MPASNPLFFAIRAVAPLDQVGWTLRVLDFRDYSTPVAVLSDFVDLTVGPQLNDPGAGSVTLDADHPFWAGTLFDGEPATTLTEREYLWEAYEDGVLRFQFLGTTITEHLLEDDETRGIAISGPGAAQVLSWACVLPAYFPPASDATHTEVWSGFPVTYSAMHIWLAMLQKAQARGTIGYVTPLFTATTDSGGEAWEVVQTQATVSDPTTPIRPDPGTNLLDLLNIHTGQDLTKQFAQRAEWVMWPGFQLDVRKTIGTHREDQVIFFEAGLDQKERTRDRADIANYVVTVDIDGHTSFSTDAESIAKWQQREQLQNQNPQVTDPARRTAISRVYLEQRKDEKSQWTIQVPYDQPGRKVFTDYDLGDWIGISTFGPDGVSTVDAFRVLAITVLVEQGAPPTLELTLQSILDARQVELQKQLTTILNAIGTGGDVTLPDPTLYPSDPPTDGWDLGWSPDSGYYGIPWGTAGSDGSGGSGGTGLRIFIQHDDPGAAANVGDFWLQI